MAEKRALVVDDEKLIVKGIRFSLEQDNMQVTVRMTARKRWSLRETISTI